MSVQYGDAHPEVQMYLLSAYCCHFYGSQSWDLSDPHILFINTAWNKAMRIIWKLPFDSHKVILSGLNKASIQGMLYLEGFIRCMKAYVVVKMKQYVRL